ncbi:WSC domain-containing protein 2 [Sphaceloma murrayae]|uniref:WSC domain-containing protein 2 n=1 Tax=Sphaceloma murrayae TaxID=2082308 RepID=A0A2K1QP27_9PEZI|nr:WSC domain-containing protein 2 [Sphaceloma murrayae]
MHFTSSAIGVAALLAAPAHAFFRMGCGSPIVTERIDPIISPGQVSGHVHQVVGGNGFGFTQDYAQARRSTCTSCTVSKDLSNYWTPILYYKNKNGQLQRVKQNGGVLVYYLQRPESNKNLKAFPEGFRMVAGDPFRRNATTDFAGKAVNFACLNYNGPAKPETMNLPPYNCPNGVRAQVFFPSCWDGKNLDSADHKSHMSYPKSGSHDNGPCPDTHPVQLVSIFYEVIFSTNELEFWAGDAGTNQPFIFAQGDATGYGFHGDFLNGWDVSLLQKAVDSCRNLSGEITDCAALTPYLQSGSVQSQCTIPDSVGEDVTGPFDKLPGCNPITSGPARAEVQTGCGATTRIAGPKLSYTDKTASGWAYQGCALDNVGARTLTGYSNVYSTDQATTSVDTCMKKCQGSQYMGLEYGKQCFCGNSIPADRVPQSSQLGQCNMPCAGNSSQICGGGSQLSLYKACTGSGCTNAVYQAVGDLTGSGGTASAASSAPVAVASSSSAAASAAAPSSSPTTTSKPAANGTGSLPVVATSTSTSSLPSGYAYVTVTQNNVVIVTAVKTVTATASPTTRRRRKHAKAHKAHRLMGRSDW